MKIYLSYETINFKLFIIKINYLFQKKIKMSSEQFCNELTGPDTEMTVNNGVIGFKKVLDENIDIEIDTSDFEGGSET